MSLSAEENPTLLSAQTLHKTADAHLIAALMVVVVIAVYLINLAS